MYYKRSSLYPHKIEYTVRVPDTEKRCLFDSRRGSQSLVCHLENILLQKQENGWDLAKKSNVNAKSVFSSIILKKFCKQTVKSLYLYTEKKQCVPLPNVLKVSQANILWPVLIPKHTMACFDSQTYFGLF